MTIMLNWYAGWGLILAGLLSGAVLGMFFHNEDFLGGYGSFPRRLIRLGHIACVALGMLNLLFVATGGVLIPHCAVLTNHHLQLTTHQSVASAAFIIGGITMPIMCFLTAWRTNLRHGFIIPVAALLLAVSTTLLAGP